VNESSEATDHECIRCRRVNRLAQSVVIGTSVDMRGLSTMCQAQMQEFFDCRELPDSLRHCNRAFMIQFILFRNIDGSFALLTLKPREVRACLL
jgi:hypothetical protein